MLTSNLQQKKSKVFFYIHWYNLYIFVYFQARGFSIDYLAKIPEVKDTVHKHSLLHHLCTIVIEQFKDSTDLYSEIGPLARCSRVSTICQDSNIWDLSGQIVLRDCFQITVHLTAQGFPNTNRIFYTQRQDH